MDFPMNAVVRVYGLMHASKRVSERSESERSESERSELLLN